MPGKKLHDPRRARRHRRYLGPVPVSRRSIRLGHVHARLFVPSVDGAESDCRRTVDSRIRSRDGTRIRHRQADPLQPARASRVLVHSGRRMDRGSGACRLGRGGAIPLRFPVHVQRLLRLRKRLHAGVSRRRSFCRPHRASAEVDARHRLRRQEGGRDRKRRDSGDARSGNGETRRARDDAAAVADVCGLGAGAGQVREHAAQVPLR